MFHSARIKLTTWYLFIIMAISLAFSTFIYVEATREFGRILRAQRDHLNFRIIQTPPFTNVVLPNTPVFITQEDADDVINQARIRVIESLVEVNMVILLLSALAGYFLAGRTLKPIQKMVDDQNRFITDASHELNTPLTAIRTTIEVNLRDKKLSLTKAKNVLESNLEEVTHLQMLSDELITLNQYQKTQDKTIQEKIALRKLIQEAIDQVVPMAKRKNIQIKRAIPQTFISGDERSLKELIIILLDNAIKYSAEKTTITLTAEQKDKRVFLHVADEGIGMSEATMQHIFDRFYRADSSRTKQQTPGYGLGLAIAQHIINVHQGKITVKSALSKGSTFTIELPVK